MVDYTDIEIKLERAKTQILEAQRIAKKFEEDADFADHIDTSTYVDNMDNLIRLLDHQLDETGNYTDLVEKGMAYKLFPTKHK